MDYFGPPWPAPAVEYGTQVPTPIGQHCDFCKEQVLPGERGLIIGKVDSDGDGAWTTTPVPVHAECNLRGILGHSVGVCRCTGYDDSRDTAREVWRRAFGTEEEL